MKIPLWLLAILLVGGYVYGGFWTYGWVWNKYPPTRMCYEDSNGEYTRNCFFIEHGPLEGAFWPIYWAGVKAIEATKS